MARVRPELVAAAPNAPAGPPLNASLPRRLAALGYEALLVSAVLLAAGFLLAPLVSPLVDPASATRVPVPGLSARIVLFVSFASVGGLYFGWFWTGGRRTLPMQTWRIRLVSAGGGPVAPRAAALRYLAFWIGPALALAAYAATQPAGLGRYAVALVAFNYAWALVDRDRQFLHDRLAGTRLVRVR